MNNKQQKTEWRGLEIELQAFEDAIANCVEIPNEWLPKEYQHGIDGCRTISNLNSLLDTRSGVSKHQQNKADKAANIENYRQQLEQNERFEYDGLTNPQQLYRNQQAFVEAQIQAGNIVIDEDEWNGT